MSNISVLYSEEDIVRAVKELGKEITRDYMDKKLLAVCVLKGAFVFAADLVRRIDGEMRISFITAKSYEGEYSTGKVSVSDEIGLSNLDLSEWNVLIIEDIIDTGRTLRELKNKFSEMGAKSVRLAVLLDKPSRRVEEITPDYRCFEIEDRFVVGYGLDYDESYRNLPYIGIVSQ